MTAAFTTNQSAQDIAKYLEMAKHRLRSAEILLKAGENKDAASRVYYGFFDATSALLLTKGLVAKTHAGLIALFNLHFVKTGKIKSQFATLFRRAKEA
ncbi:HEPN domain-containing protein [Candidatus Parcubacteria bacterium]|nr:HEPN domain-containing protein [Candidatus Parcubacteria bacterium]